MNIIISRTDNLGDVMLTLPMAGIIKSYHKESKIFFIGKSYTKSLIENCQYIDGFIDREQIISGKTNLTQFNATFIIHVYPDKEIAKAAKNAGIPQRIGTSHRLFHWKYCNKRINLSRKSSDLHESQLNIKLLAPLGITRNFTLEEISEFTGFKKPEKTENEKFKLIIHPKSKGSAREWLLENYYQLVGLLPKNQFEIFITGTREEGARIKAEHPDLLLEMGVTDLTGKLSLEQLIDEIGKCDALLACSTGPLHIAAASDIEAIGIYPPMRPLHPGRWAPIGKKVKVFAVDKNCIQCKKSNYCACVNSIAPETIKNHLIEIAKKKRIT